MFPMFIAEGEIIKQPMPENISSFYRFNSEEVKEIFALGV
jgi:hypothetical protein